MKMSLKDLITLVNDAYPDDQIEMHFDDEKNRPIDAKNSGDGLALFIVRELCETFDPQASRKDQLEEALRVMEVARDELARVCNKLADTH